jgi:hypothetical protein
MSELQNLKLTAFTAPTQPDPVQHRRDKLAAKLMEQIESAQAAEQGTEYRSERVRRVKTETGTEQEVVQRRVRNWFRAIDDRRWVVMVFYGARQLDLAKNKNAVEVVGIAGVRSALETLKKAVLAGELDAQIATAAESLKRGFKR